MPCLIIISRSGLTVDQNIDNILTSTPLGLLAHSGDYDEEFLEARRQALFLGEAQRSMSKGLTMTFFPSNWLQQPNDDHYWWTPDVIHVELPSMPWNALRPEVPWWNYQVPVETIPCVPSPQCLLQPWWQGHWEDPNQIKIKNNSGQNLDSSVTNLLWEASYSLWEM